MLLEISQELKDKLEYMDEKLQASHGQWHERIQSVRATFESGGVRLHAMKAWPGEDINNWLNDRGLGAVDGSVNQAGAEPPHVIYFFQALAMMMNRRQYESSDIYIPLIEEDDEEEWKTARSTRMASLELETARRMIVEEKPGLVMMDGSLMHYRIEASESWAALRETALAQGVYLIGVSEEVGTRYLADWPPIAPHAAGLTYDKDILFGVLKPSEWLYLAEAQQKEELETVWMRASSDPAITGVDILKEQAEQLPAIMDIVYSFTPQESRGIPLPLDLVDKNVRITNQMVETLVEQYISPDFRYRFFRAKREDRIF
ncbi:NurA domain-containing protein [Salsuginibacillus halophilus]|uniref:NurA domain-containing protein n=1 Tax=Salsuginibacillus halophilus TaxID=517424 RepID=A0A2P8H7T1_9BACI|nr:DNA double-strand break repair nuclease NurA [Salsuginibacillus halophilus]PSL42240.1 NurA domain-containing protein [Salsuginibacillus halophilus]